MKRNSQLRNSQRPILTRAFFVVLRVVLLGVGVLGVGSLVGCAKAKAASVPDGPPLSVPQPPERVLAPVEPPSPVVAAAPRQSHHLPPYPRHERRRERPRAKRSS